MPVSADLSKTLVRTFISKVDVAEADSVHALLAENPALRAALKGEVGDHAIHNLDSRVISLEAQQLQTRAIQAQSKYPEAFEGDLQTNEKFLKGWKSILTELQGMGANLTDRLKKFVGG